MHRLILVCCGFICAAGAAFADTGGWSNSVGATYAQGGGSIYVTEENRDISLDEETLTFRGPSDKLETRAVFQFHNSSKNDLTVDVGFPIRVTLRQVSVRRKAGSAGPQARVVGVHYDELLLPTLKALFGPQGIQSAEGYEMELPPSGKDIDVYWGPAGRDVMVVTASDESKNRVSVPRGKVGDPFGFRILQDGVPIVPDSVLLEWRLQGGLQLYWHYHFKATFKGRSTSVMEVTYTAPGLRGESGDASTDQYGVADRSYSWDYILGTGRTWSGKIKKLLLAIPADAQLQFAGDGKPFSELGNRAGERLYLASNYEPGQDDAITVEKQEMYIKSVSTILDRWAAGAPDQGTFAKAPAQDFVTVDGASSFLKDHVSVYLTDGRYDNVDYSPLRAFDGQRVGAWVEGAPGDGIGEWLEFEIGRDIEGLQVQNGFSLSLIDALLKGKQLGSYYGRNNRVRVMEFVSADGKVKRMVNLADTKDLQTIRDVSLPKGRYKLYIRSVHKGTQWSDTGLGEVTFFPTNEKAEKLIAGDEFLKKYF